MFVIHCYSEFLREGKTKQMIARIIINGKVIEKSRIEKHSMSGSKEDFVKSVIKENGVWDDKGIYFYPYHKIDKIEFR